MTPQGQRESVSLLEFLLSFILPNNIFIYLRGRAAFVGHSDNICLMGQRNSMELQLNIHNLIAIN